MILTLFLIWHVLGAIWMVCAWYMASKGDTVPAFDPDDPFQTLLVILFAGIVGFLVPIWMLWIVLHKVVFIEKE